MKLEIEITEDEIRSEIERKIRTAISDQSNHWHADDYIKNQVKAKWETAVAAIIQDVLNNSQVIREKVEKEVERKIRAQLQSLMKATDLSK